MYLKHVLIFIGTFLMVGSSFAHSVQVRYCVNCDAHLRLWFEHWHGTEDFNLTTMTIQYSVGGGPVITQTESPVGGLIDVEDVESLPGCISQSVYAAGCPDQNNYKDWVYYDYADLPTGVPVTFTIISGNSAFTMDGCGMYPLEFEITIPPVSTAELSSTVIEEVVCVDADEAHVGFVGSGGISPYTFQYTMDNGPVQTVTSVGDTVFVPVPTSIIGDFTYEIVAISQGSTGDCSQPQSSVGVVTISPKPTGTISGSTEVCSNDIQPVLTLEGSQGVAPYTFTYKIDGGEPQTITSAGNTATISVPTSAVGTFEYELVGVEDSNSLPCSQTLNETAFIVVNPFPTALISVSQDVCVGDLEPIVTLEGFGGTAPYMFTYKLNDGEEQVVNSEGNKAYLNISSSVAGTFEYTLIAVGDASASACSQTQEGSSIVMVNPLPTAMISGSINVCRNDPEPVITLEAAGGTAPYTFSYRVNGGEIQTITSLENIAQILAPTSSDGIFEYELVSVQDASSTSCSQLQEGVALVVVNPLPTAVILGSADICRFDPEPLITFQGADGVAPYTFMYTLNDGTPQTLESIGNIATIQVPSAEPGIYEYGLISVQDASSTACLQLQESEVVITVNALPEVTAGEGFAICYNDQAVLNGSGALTYVWSNGVVDGVHFTPLATKNYTVTGTDGNGCVAMDEILITVNPLPEVSFFGDSLETCGAPHEVEFTNTTLGDVTECVWNFGDGNELSQCTDVTHIYENPGLYDVTLTVTLTTGCIDASTYEDYIHVKPNPIASFYPSENIVNNLETEVLFDNTSEGAVAYQWDFGDQSSVVTTFSPNHYFPDENAGTYLVELIAFSDLGCTDTISETIEVEEEPLYYVPNAFTPNIDGYNEEFKPVFTSGFNPNDFNMLIYNRDGEVIFESHEVTLGWDGTFQDVLVQNGLYVWNIVFAANVGPERIVLQGHVSVIR